MRRLVGLLLAALLAVGLVLPPAAASADPGPIVLAVEGEGVEPQGPEPRGPNEDPTVNPAAPTEYEANFLWGAAVGLLALTVAVVAAVGGLYYLLVWRPRQQEQQRAGSR